MKKLTISLIVFALADVVNAVEFYIEPCAPKERLVIRTDSKQAAADRVERWSPEQSKWVETTSSAVEEGVLYRVSVCDAGNCETSKVAWSPIMVCPWQRTPEKLATMDQITRGFDASGAEAIAFNPPKNHTEHNAFLAGAAVFSFGGDRANAPPMAKPPFVPREEASSLDYLRWLVYITYENVRLQDIPDIEDTTWGDVPFSPLYGKWPVSVSEFFAREEAEARARGETITPHEH